MGLETPVGAGIEAGGGERTLDTQLALACLHIVGDGLQRVEGVDVFDGLGLRTVKRKVLVQDGLVVDKAVSFHGVRHADDLVAVLEGDLLVDELLVRLGVGHVGGVILPVGIADRTVDLEQGRSIALGHFALELLLIGSGCCGSNGDLDAGFLGVFLGEGLPLVRRFRLEVQVIDLALAVVAAAGAAAACERADGHGCHRCDGNR